MSPAERPISASAPYSHRTVWTRNDGTKLATFTRSKKHQQRKLLETKSHDDHPIVKRKEVSGSTRGVKQNNKKVRRKQLGFG